VAGAARDKDFHVDFRLYNIRPDAKGVMTYRVATGPSAATPITNGRRNVRDVACRRRLFKSCVIESIHEGGPTFSNPKSIHESQTVGNQAASYVLAGLLLSMLVAFVAFDLNAVRREPFFKRRQM